MNPGGRFFHGFGVHGGKSTEQGQINFSRLMSVWAEERFGPGENKRDLCVVKKVKIPTHAMSDVEIFNKAPKHGYTETVPTMDTNAFIQVVSMVGTVSVYPCFGALLNISTSDMAWVGFFTF